MCGVRRFCPIVCLLFTICGGGAARFVAVLFLRFASNVLQTQVPSSLPITSPPLLHSRFCFQSVLPPSTSTLQAPSFKLQAQGPGFSPSSEFQLLLCYWHFTLSVDTSGFCIYVGFTRVKYGRLFLSEDLCRPRTFACYSVELWLSVQVSALSFSVECGLPSRAKT